jgi:hypothetical protein
MARRKKLQKMREIARDRILAEPITAIVTIPVAFVGPIFWEISWLSYPLLVILVRGRRQTKIE